MANRIASFTLVVEGLLFFRSKRGFRILGGAESAVLSPRDSKAQLAVFVTPGWWLRSFFVSKKRFDSVVVLRPYGRFGNQVIQLANAVRVSLAFGVESIFSPQNLASTGSFSLRDASAQGISLRTGVVLPLYRKNVSSIVRSFFAWKSSLCGDFFSLDQVCERKLSQIPLSASYDVLTGLLGYGADIGLGSDHLVIHLRGGDIFGENPSPHYGQPPLGFYRAVLSSDCWTECTVVFADEANPVLSPLLNLISASGLSLSVQQSSLEEDLRVLLSAKSLVASRSTLISSIANLSSAIERVFVFGTEDFFIGLYREDIPLYSGVDLTGGYWTQVCDENWAGSPEQIALMLEYPHENLAIRPVMRP